MEFGFSDDFIKIEKLDTDEFDKQVQRELGYVAAEFKHLGQLKTDLSGLSREIKTHRDALKKSGNNQEKKETIKAIRKALKGAISEEKQIGRAERRLHRYENIIRDNLKQLELIRSKVGIKIGYYSGIYSDEDAKNLSERINTEFAELIAASSWYGGRIRKYLDQLKEEVNKKQVSVFQITNLLDEVTTLVNGTVKWITALSSDLGKAKKQFDNFASSNRSSFRLRGDLLIERGKYKEAIETYKKEYLTKEGWQKVAVKLINRKAYEYAAKALENIPGIENGISALANYLIKNGRYDEAYETMEKGARNTDWVRAAKYLLSIKKYEKAVKFYLKAGLKPEQYVFIAKHLVDLKEYRLAVDLFNKKSKENVLNKRDLADFGDKLIEAGTTSFFDAKQWEAVLEAMIKEKMGTYESIIKAGELAKLAKERWKEYGIKLLVEAKTDRGLNLIALDIFRKAAEIINEDEWKKIGKIFIARRFESLRLSHNC